MKVAKSSFLRIRVGIRAGGPEQHAFAQIHQVHEHAGDDDDHQCGREDEWCAEGVVGGLQPDAESAACAQVFGGSCGGEDICGGDADAAVDLPCGDTQFHMP